jgi:hypothetical protein
MAIQIFIAASVVLGTFGFAIAYRWIGTAVGLVCLVVFGLCGTVISMLHELSETPDNSMGNPQRVHVRNDSSTVVYFVARDQLVEDEVRGLHPVRPDGLVIIPGRWHPADRSHACTDEPMALVHGRNGVTAESANGGFALDPADVVVLAELVQCFPRGRNVVVWDGQRAFVDPDARPPAIDPGLAAMVYGWSLGGVVLLMGVTTDAVHVLLRRRRGPAASPPDWPTPVVRPASDATTDSR